MVVFINRLRVFFRTSYQWIILIIPTIYVVIQLFIAYSIIVAVTNGVDVSDFLPIFFTFYFTFFLVFGQSLTAALFGFTPMQEKKDGLRQMMYMSGLTSL